MTRKTNDGLKSLVSGLGDPARDKLAGSSYGSRVLTDNELKDLYETSWMAAKIVDIPANDALRKWRDWKADAEQITAIESEEKRLNIRGELLQCKKLARLWGGAALYIGIKGDEDPSQPLDPKTVIKGGIEYVRAMSRRDITADELDQDIISAQYGKPKLYQINGAGKRVDIHPSRLVVQFGKSVIDPINVSGPERSWGYSVLKHTYEAVRNADATCGNVASLVFEANIDVFGIPDFMTNLSDPDYEKKIIDRATLAATGKSINKTLLMDKDETYDRKQVSFAQLPEIMKQFLVLVSGAADIPLTRFLGQSPGGLSSTGSGDMKNYYDMITSIQTLEIEPALWQLDEALIRSSLGDRPGEIWYSWAPLELMNEKEVAEIGKITADTADVLTRSGLFEAEELRDVVANSMTENGVFPSLTGVVKGTKAKIEEEDDLGDDNAN
jgi:phage-related protein (TIGR01555 family)